MATNTETSGTVISFYSYKGGVGRSMTAANFACLLARRASASGRRILLIDWDLEAPGLHRFFPEADRPPNNGRPGLIEFFRHLSDLLTDNPPLAGSLASDECVSIFDEVLPLSEYIISDVFPGIPGIDLLKAGNIDAGYPSLVNSFDWGEFYDKRRDVLAAFRRLLTAKYLYTIIDSRTGITDISGISTVLLAEKLITVFTTNRQSLQGVLDFTRMAVEYRRSSDDFRSLVIFPVPSRIELAEHELRQTWRKEYQKEFEKLFKDIYDLSECDLTAYFDDVQLPYVSYYAYGETIAVNIDRDETISLRRAYEAALQRVVDLDSPWADPSALPGPANIPTASQSVDEVTSSYRSASSQLQENRAWDVKLRFDALSQDILRSWATLQPTFASQPNSGPQVLRLLINASAPGAGTTLAMVRFDADITFPDWKRFIETILKGSRRDQGFESLLSVPGATSGFLYMVACMGALHWRSWTILRRLLRDKFEWYYQSGRPLYDFGFNLAPFFHPEALRRDAPKTHDLFRAALSEPAYPSLLSVDPEGLLNLYLQTQLLHCLRAAQEAEKPKDDDRISIWADFGRFHDFRVLPLLDRIFNDSDFSEGISFAFGESPTDWKLKLSSRLRRIRSEYFSGAPYSWDSIEDDYAPRRN